MKFGVVTFPGSNCDYDAYAACRLIGEEVDFLWHQSAALNGCDVIILPGGFAYGDYLRSGAIARFSTIMKSVVRFAENGGLVIGICNGFQVLVESGLLPGALMRNEHLRFSCKFVYIRVEKTDNPFTLECGQGDIIKIPIAHKDGNYYNFQGDLDELMKHNQILFRYCDKDGQITRQSNPNGSAYNIAGITNRDGNVVGIMPHPERAVEDILGSSGGLKIFESVRRAVKARVAIENA
ncbi:MAG: phosphoribosylformylglycinamidine synthase subunit PurQ [Candidatus Zixiibacteriota bacterium]|nr:MAG: phosphoribosylformylglycinamidine synthase subunit PurQ [candidate division Zixibacteria bacterium]